MFEIMMGAAAPAAGAVQPYVDNTMLLLVSAMVVMFMAAGFCCLEGGLVRQKNVAAICLKNISLFSLACIAYYLVGYRLMYDGVDGGFIGTLGVWSPGPMDEANGDMAASADWIFQTVFVATAASVVSGTLAERIKLWPFLFFVLILTAIIYPITGAWKWGEGWLAVRGFQDFAGSTLVHSVGGWSALTGAIILGPRLGKYLDDGRVRPFPGSNLPFATLGVFILWLGWFGFNGGSQLAAGTISDANAVAKIFANTNIAACAGVLTAMAISQLHYGKVDLTLALNGAIGGLVSITAEPLAPALWQSMIVGGVGGVLVVYAVPLLDRLKIDDVVGAIPAHLVCGIWGTLIVAWTGMSAETGFFTLLGSQLLGVVSIGAFVVASTLGVWFAIDRTVGLRVSAEDEQTGLDQTELGIEAYPDFLARG